MWHQRHCRLENDQRSSLRILSKKGLCAKERDRGGSLDVFDQYAGNPLALEEAILAQPSNQWRAAREKLRLRSEASGSTHHHPLYFSRWVMIDSNYSNPTPLLSQFWYKCVDNVYSTSRLDAALAAQERCTTTASAASCVSISEEKRGTMKETN